MECSKNGTLGYLTKPITIYALPSSPDIAYDIGTLSIQNIEANTNYQWFEDGVVIPGQTTTQYNNFIGNQYNNGTFTILASNGNSCSIVSQPFIVVQPLFNTPVDSSCTSYGGTVFNQSEIINGMTCTWNLNNVSTVSTSQASINYDEAGWYNIELTCQLGNTSMSYTDSIWITQSPTAPSLAYNSLGNVSCTNFIPSETHLWFQNGQWITGATSSNFSIYDGTQYVSGWYRMNAINNNGCLTQGDSIYVLQPEFNLSMAQACQGEVITLNTNNNIPDNYECQVLWRWTI